MTPLYRAIASALQARRNCIDSKNVEWEEKHEARALDLTKRHMPSGAGIDSGTSLDLDASSAQKLVFHASYHHMNEDGAYDGWTDHTIRVYPSLTSGIRTTISGPNRNQVKDYLCECYDNALRSEVDEYPSEKGGDVAAIR